RPLFDEAEVVAPPVDDVERALAPGTLDRLARRLSVHLVGRERLEVRRARVRRVEILHGEVERLRTGRRVHASLRDVEDGQDHAAAIEVVTRAGMALAGGAEQLGVE